MVPGAASVHTLPRDVLTKPPDTTNLFLFSFKGHTYKSCIQPHIFGSLVGAFPTAYTFYFVPYNWKHI